MQVEAVGERSCVWWAVQDVDCAGSAGMKQEERLLACACFFTRGWAWAGGGGLAWTRAADVPGMAAAIVAVVWEGNSFFMLCAGGCAGGCAGVRRVRRSLVFAGWCRGGIGQTRVLSGTGSTRPGT